MSERNGFHFSLHLSSKVYQRMPMRLLKKLVILEFFPKIHKGWRFPHILDSPPRRRVPLIVITFLSYLKIRARLWLSDIIRGFKYKAMRENVYGERKTNGIIHDVSVEFTFEIRRRNGTYKKLESEPKKKYVETEWAERVNVFLHRHAYIYEKEKITIVYLI